MIKRSFSAYIAIGILVAMYAWNIDTSESKGEAWPVLVVIAALWPLWILLYAVFS
jgi:hypothetical protein